MNSSRENSALTAIEKFQEYIKRIIDDYTNPELKEKADGLIDKQLSYGIGEYFIAPAAVLDKTEQIFDPVDLFIDPWLNDSTKNSLVILGDYGAGKSALSWNVCYKLAKSLTETNGRIPIYINLRKEGHIEDISEFILKKIEMYGVVLTKNEFDLLTSLGRFLVVLDSFDELELDVTEKQITSNWREINKLCQGNMKVLISCRSTFFKSRQDLQVTINHRITKSTIDGFEILQLQDWSTPKIEKYLENHFKGNWKYYWNRATFTHQSLAYLARRPLFLMVMVAQVPDLIKRLEGIKLYDLFDNYVENISNREADLSDLNRQSKTNILQNIALSFTLTPNIKTFSNDQITKFVEMEFESRTLTPDKAEKYNNDIRNSGFLTREDGQFKFSNSLFQSYFAAQRLARELKEYNTESFKKIALDPDCMAFLLSMLQVNNQLPDNIISLLKEFINDTKGRDFSKVRYLGSNSLTLLSLNGTKLDGEDFSSTVLQKSNLSRASLQKVSFLNSDLKGVNFDSANLSGVNLQKANLDGASFRGGEGIGSLKVSPDGKYIASGDNAGVIKIWDLATLDFVTALESHSRAVWSVSWNPLTIKPTLASGGLDGTVRIWDVLSNTQKILLRHGSTVSCVEFSPNGQFIASCGGEGKIYVNDAYNGKLVWSHIIDEQIHCIRWSPDGESLATASGDKRIAIWNHAKNGDLELEITEHEDTVWNVSWHPDCSSRLLASGSRDTTIRIWRIYQEVRKVCEIDRFTDPFGHMASVYYVAWSPDGKYIASSGADTKVIVWNWLERKLLFKRQMHTDDVWSLDWSPPKIGRLVSGSEDRTITVWDAEERIPPQVIIQLPRCTDMDLTEAKELKSEKKKMLLKAGARMNYNPSWIK